MSLILSLLISVIGMYPGQPADTTTVDIKEWDVPYEDSRPRDPYVGPDGRVWFVGQKADYVASLDPESGEFKKYDLERGTGPHTVIVGDDGTVWIAGNQKAYIGKMDPDTGVIEKIAMPDPKAVDPHTMAFTSDGDIWFTLQVSNRIGLLDTETNEIQLVQVETPSARPYGIKVDGADRPWIALVGTNKIASVDPETMKLHEIPLPREDAHPRRLVVASDGAVWYVDHAEGFLGRYDPDTMSFEEWQMPGGSDARPYGMAIDDRDHVWFVETGLSPNRFVGFNPDTEEFYSMSEVPSGGGTVRHMFYHEPTASVWFGADTNTIGRAKVKVESGS